MNFALARADPVMDMRCVMTEDESFHLKQMIERSYGCASSLIQSVRIRETIGETMTWEGIVHVFELIDHPKAIRAYGWFSSINGGEKRRPHAVLHSPHMSSPRKAVQTVLIAERKPSPPHLKSAS